MSTAINRDIKLMATRLMNFPYFILSSLLVFACSCPLEAQEVLGIGVPYLPNKLNIIKSVDAISEAISINTISHFGEGTEKTSLTSERRRETANGQDWILEYKPNISLDGTTTFEPQMILDTIEYFKATKEENFSSVLNNIKSTSSSKDSSLNSVTISLKEADNNFPKKISSIPLINAPLAELFKESIGSGTNMPTYGNFIVKEFRPEEQLLLLRNRYFGLDNNPLGYEIIQFKIFPKDGSRIKALRTGNIMIILLPTQEELKDSESDSTLEIISSPLKEEIPASFERGDIDYSKIILRKSLLTDKSFKDAFRLEGIKRGE